MRDIRPGPDGSDLRDITAAGDRLYFSADDGEHGMELWVSDGTSTLDLFGHGFVLLQLGPDTGRDAPDGEPLAAAARCCKMPLEFITIEDPAVLEAYEHCFVLVRPDGHVAWRGDEFPTDPARLIDIVRGAPATGDANP